MPLAPLRCHRIDPAASALKPAWVFGYRTVTGVADFRPHRLRCGLPNI